MAAQASGRRSAVVCTRRGPGRCAALWMLLVVWPAAGADESQRERLALQERGRAVLRAMDCARCHGRDYRGWAAPSLLAAVREGSRERFERFVLEGDPVRGMPGYRSQPLVVASLDAIYAYLQAQASGAAAPGAASSASSAGGHDKR